MQEKITLDAGYTFGMGVFETIGVEKGKPLFLSWHLQRLKEGLKTLGIDGKTVEEKAAPEQIETYLEQNYMEHGVLKIMVSEKNILFQTRENPYTEADYKRGFRLDISKVIRNETSPFTYIKSFHYGDNLLEKRRAKKAGYDETLFLNSAGQVAETSASNIFFIKDRTLYTPSLECGLLPGIVRKYLLENYPVQEMCIMPGDISDFQEAFLTNSLMGIMPVQAIGDYVFESTRVTREHMLSYWKAAGK